MGQLACPSAGSYIAQTAGAAQPSRDNPGRRWLISTSPAGPSRQSRHEPHTRPPHPTPHDTHKPRTQPRTRAPKLPGARPHTPQPPARTALSRSNTGTGEGSTPRSTARYSDMRSPSRTSETTRSVRVPPTLSTRKVAAAWPAISLWSSSGSSWAKAGVFASPRLCPTAQASAARWGAGRRNSSLGAPSHSLNATAHPSWIRLNPAM